MAYILLSNNVATGYNQVYYGMLCAHTVMCWYSKVLIQLMVMSNKGIRVHIIVGYGSSAGIRDLTIAHV